jgi:uncharacterized protein with GYD domain
LSFGALIRETFLIVRAILMITSGGAVGLETLKAIPADKAEEIIKSLP